MPTAQYRPLREDGCYAYGTLAVCSAPRHEDRSVATSAAYVSLPFQEGAIRGVSTSACGARPRERVEQGGEPRRYGPAQLTTLDMLRLDQWKNRAYVQILVVDDDPGVRQLVAMTLASEGWVVRTAADGVAALDEAQQCEFDAVVLDLQMPVMDGRAFYNALRGMPSSVPVLLLSAYGSRSAQRELGANDALDKPFDPMVLVQRLKKLTSGTT